MKIYTRTGDDGTSGLLGNGRVPKHHLRLEAFGTVDELNAYLGLCQAILTSVATDLIRPWLETIQADLLTVGAHLATPDASDYTPPEFPASRTTQLEHWIDELEKELPELKNFILPKGTLASTHLHVARSICRRAERAMVHLHDQIPIEPVLITYINRLSDLLFVMARWVNLKEGGSETVWDGKAPQTDRLKDSLQKIAQDKAKRKDLFEKMSGDLQKKKELAQKSFLESVQQINKEGGKVAPPIRPIDLD